MKENELIPRFEDMCKRCGFDINQPYHGKAFSMIVTLFLISENADTEENYQTLMEYGLPY